MSRGTRTHQKENTINGGSSSFPGLIYDHNSFSNGSLNLTGTRRHRRACLRLNSLLHFNMFPRSVSPRRSNSPRRTSSSNVSPWIWHMRVTGEVEELRCLPQCAQSFSLLGKRRRKQKYREKGKGGREWEFDFQWGRLWLLLHGTFGGLPSVDKPLWNICIYPHFHALLTPQFSAGAQQQLRAIIALCILSKFPKRFR